VRPGSGDDRCGPPVSQAGGRGKVAQGRGISLRRKWKPGGGATGSQACWADGERWRLRKEWASAGGLGRLGQNQRSFKTDLIFEFQWISNFGKALDIFTWIFRRNLDMGIFLKSSRLLKDF
jgi:hypothetical protein